MKKAPVIILLACISLLASCGKNPFSNGEEKEYDRQLEGQFKVVDIGDNLKFIGAENTDEERSLPDLLARGDGHRGNHTVAAGEDPG